MPTSLQTQFPAAQTVLDYWFADGLQLDWPSTNLGKLWFGGGIEQDALIRQRFGDLVECALRGELTEWESSPLDRLALVVLLDQFSRNMYRGQAHAFSGDARAQQLVLATIESGAHKQLPTVGRVFLYMPLMHAENWALQQACLERFTELSEASEPALQAKLQGNLSAAQEHLDIIKRFGRFPHRNATLGRASTAEEALFLQHGPRFGQ